MPHIQRYIITGSRDCPDFPDFNTVTSFYKVLSESDVNLSVLSLALHPSLPVLLAVFLPDNTNSRVILIGDVHGMNESLQ